jgi:hypothetical protein
MGKLLVLAAEACAAPMLRWIEAYEERLASLTGAASNDLPPDDDGHATDRYWDHLWVHHLTGADAIALADRDAGTQLTPPMGIATAI